MFSEAPATAWGALLAALGLRPVSSQEIRAESFFLGNRHHGDILEGARRELQSPRLSAERAALLRAVIRTARGGVSEPATP